MPLAIGFDIYGTLVNPLEMNGNLRPMVGELADRFPVFTNSIRRLYAERVS